MKDWVIEAVDDHTILFVHKKDFRSVFVGANDFNEYGPSISPDERGFDLYLSH